MEDRVTAHLPAGLCVRAPSLYLFYEVAVPGAEDEAECPLGELAGLPGTVLASACGSLQLSARGPAPQFIFIHRALQHHSAAQLSIP